MDRLTKFLVNRPKASLGILALTFLLFGVSASTVQKKSGVKSLLSATNQLVLLKERMSDTFGNPNVAFIGIPPRDSSADEIRDLEKLHRIVERLKSEKLAISVVSVFSVKSIEESPEGFSIEPLINQPPKTEAELKLLHQKIDRLPSFKGQIVGLSERAYAAIIEFEPATNELAAKQLLLEILEKENANDWFLSGLPIINAWVLELIEADQIFLVPAFFLCLIFILFAAFGTLRGVFIPLANLIFSIVITIGAMAAVGISLNVVTDVLPLLIAALASAYSVHFINQYYDERRENPDLKKKELVPLAVKRILPTITMAGLTTILGFLASVSSGIPAIREFSVFAAVGVLAVLFSLATLSPVILLLLPDEKSLPKERKFHIQLNSLLRKIGDFVQIKPKVIVMIAAVIAILSSFACFKVESKYSALDYFRSNARVVTDARATSVNFGGFSSFDIAITGPAGRSPLQPEVLKVIDDFSDQILQENRTDIKVTMSVSESIKELRQAYNGEKKYYGLPKSEAELAQYLEMYEWSSNYREDFKNFISKDGQTIRLTGKFSVIEEGGDNFFERPVQYHANLIAKWIDQLNKNLPSGFEAKQYGDVPLWSHVVDEVIIGQIMSITLAILIIFLITATSLKSVAIGAICMVPVTLAVLVNFAVMALLDIQLDIATSLISGMALGIGIDDTIHFTLTLKREYQRTNDMGQAVTSTLLLAGKPIIYTSIALTVGFCTYFASGFKPIIHFGLLNAVTLVTTTISALVVLPAVFLTFKPKTFKG